ncbi:hypothetical protein Adt_35087 [Abeliophyllum distichum]|uniref:Uncharacterized protein n=1 Tax=Abeliophyllum distichum TaxID=126358 RepID=A0ABD1QDQ2_9LAMI
MLGSFLTSKEYRLAAWPSHLGFDQTAAWPSHLGFGQTTAWLLPYLEGASACCVASHLRFDKTAAWPFHLGLRETAAWLLPDLQGALSCCLALPPGTRTYCSLAPPLPPRSIASLLRPPTWDSAKLQVGSSLISKKHRLAAWPSHLGLGQTAAWLLPYPQGASPHCLALTPGTQPNCSLAPPLSLKSIASLLGPLIWDSAKLRFGSSLISQEHRLAAWRYHLGLEKTTASLFPYLQVASPCYLPSHMGLGHTTAWLLPYLQEASPHYFVLPPGTRPNCSLAPSLPPMSIALLLGPPSWDSALLQLGPSLTSKERRLTASPSHLGLGQTTACLLPYRQGESPRSLARPPGTLPNYCLAPSLPSRSIATLLRPSTWDTAKLQLGSSLTSKEHRLATWPSHLGLDQPVAWLLPYLQGASSRCLALPPGTRPYCNLVPPLLPRTSPCCLALPPGTRPNCSLALPLPTRSIALRLVPTTWDLKKLQLGSFLTSKDHRLGTWPSHLGLGHTVALLLPYLQGASLHCFALLPGSRPSYSLAPSLRPRCIASLLGPPTWTRPNCSLAPSLSPKKYRLATWPSHLGLDQTAAWLFPYLQGASPHCLALQPGTRKNLCLAPPLPPWSIALLLGPPTWDSAILYLGSSLNSKEHLLTTWPSNLGLGPTVIWLLPYHQGPSPHYLALPPVTRPNCSLDPSIPPRSIALRLVPTTWDWEKLQLGSSLTSKEHHLTASPSHQGLGHTAAWLLLYLQGASPHYFALPPGTRPNYSLAPSLRPRSIASLLGSPTWDSVKLQLCSFLTTKEHRLVAWPSHPGLSQTASWLLPCLQKASHRYLALPPGTWPNCSLALPYLQGASPCALWLPYLQGASPHNFALSRGTQSNYSLAPSLRPRSIVSLVSPPTWDSAKLQLSSFLTCKEHRLAARPSHLGLNQTAYLLLPCLQKAFPHCLALPHGTRPYCSLGPPLPPRSIVLLLGPPTWDSALLQVGSSLTSKEHHLTASPSHLGLDKTAAWLLPYLQGASPSCLALPPWTWPNYSLTAPLPPRIIALLLGPPIWDSTKLRLVSSLTSKEHRLKAWPYNLGLEKT